MAGEPRKTKTQLDLTHTMPACHGKQHQRLRILFYGGRLANSGITVSFLTLLATLGHFDIDVTVITDGDSVTGAPESMANLHKLPPFVRVMHRQGVMIRTADERAALVAFYRDNHFTSDAQQALIKQVFQKEARRVFGDTPFDIVIDFCGYSRFWGLLLASIPAQHRAIWQHNDLWTDAKLRVDVLHGVFQTYHWYDRVISVCEEIRVVNMRNLGHLFKDASASVTVRNLIDPAEIRHKAKQPLVFPMPRRGQTTRFIMIGRLSPEKAQNRAIYAIAGLVKAGHDVELLIIGDGPLRAELAGLIDALGMSDRIKLLGHIDNPFPYLAASDCFVLPSDYEGQALVLLEALVLGIPIIASDIPCTRGLLQGMQGCLVDRTVEGVATGLLAFLQGKVGVTAFDATAYCIATLDEFCKQALGLPKMPMLLPSSAA